jgi:aquaporin TIP
MSTNTSVVHIESGELLEFAGMLSIEMTSARLIAIAMAHGLAISFLTGATGAISGGHLNPAVTLAFVVAGKETLMRAGLYVAAQVIF